MSEKSKSISVVMPALNEEKNVEAAITTLKPVLNEYFQDWEILLFNDGSTDHTGEIADKLSLEDPRIRVTHHKSPRNLGGVYKAGIKLAKKEFLIMVPGDNENGSDTLGNIFELAGRADMVIPYVVNTEVRSWQRRTLSRAFVGITNLISGFKVKYYNGTVLHKVSCLREINIETDGFGYAAEAIVKLLRLGKTYTEVGIELAVRPEGSSKALKLGNIVKVASFLGSLTLSIYGKKVGPARPTQV